MRCKGSNYSPNFQTILGFFPTNPIPKNMEAATASTSLLSRKLAEKSIIAME